MIHQSNLLRYNNFKMNRHYIINPFLFYTLHASLKYMIISLTNIQLNNDKYISELTLIFFLDAYCF